MRACCFFNSIIGVTGSTGLSYRALFAPSGQEDLAVTVEAVDQTFDGVRRGRTHRREDSRGTCGVKPEGRP